VGAVNGNLNYSNTGLITPGDNLGPVPAAFPKGFNAFYCQKYETSQDQWVSFFNTLTLTQKTNRHPNQFDNNGNTVFWDGVGSATTTTPDRGMNFLSTDDAKAYLDWAALRPMTELEFEKACRGPLPTVADGFAWGSTNINGTAYTLVSAGTANENISNMGTGTGNALYSLTRPGGVSQPRRCGIFASSAINKNREETGGSYYGIMEFSGSLWENTVDIGSPESRSFTGLHGNGIISAAGNSTVGGWGFTGGVRGGGNGNPAGDLAISQRRLSMFPIGSRFSDVSFRAVRSAN
jgi:formylglycine-generating enzyme required for sulfatase activity